MKRIFAISFLLACAFGMNAAALAGHDDSDTHVYEALKGALGRNTSTPVKADEGLQTVSNTDLAREVVRRFPNASLGVATGFAATLACSPIDKLTANRQVQSTSSRNAFKAFITKPYQGSPWAFGKSVTNNLFVYMTKDALTRAAHQAMPQHPLAADAAGGAAAGVVASYGVAPLNLFKTYGYIRSTQDKSLVAIFVQMPKRERLLELKTGAHPAALCKATYWGLYLMAKEQVEELARVNPSAVLPLDRLDKKTRKAIIGGTTGVFAAACSFPFDTLSKRQIDHRRAQLQCEPLVRQKTPNSWQIARQLVAKQGLTGLYSGFPFAMLRMFIYGAVINTTESAVKDFCGASKKMIAIEKIEETQA